MSTITIRLNDEEEKIYREYAESKNISLSTLMKEALQEKIEDEIDFKLYEEGMKELERDGKTYTHEEVLMKLGIKREEL